MRFLACTYYYYYDDPNGVEPQFYYLCRVPQSMGHEVDFFDWRTLCHVGVEQMRSQFLTMVRGGNYDAVFIATHLEEFDEVTLSEARRHCPIIAFNSDDEDRWDSYSSKRVSWYSFMVTNSPTVYNLNQTRHANLLHAQWACCGFWDGRQKQKDIDVSFVGQIYGKRMVQVEELRRTAGLRSFGKGIAPRVGEIAPGTSCVKLFIGQTLTNFLHKRLPDVFRSSTISFEQVNSLWNRTRVSFTPLESSRGGDVFQIKSRVFDMGLSGTLMIAPKAAPIEQYFEPGKEYVQYDDLQDFAEKARYYCSHENERQKIATAYSDRVLAEHMWSHRINHVLHSAGLI